MELTKGPLTARFRRLSMLVLQVIRKPKVAVDRLRVFVRGRREALQGGESPRGSLLVGPFLRSPVSDCPDHLVSRCYDRQDGANDDEVLGIVVALEDPLTRGTEEASD